jgi:hypothetical protein
MVHEDGGRLWRRKEKRTESAWTVVIRLKQEVTGKRVVIRDAVSVQSCRQYCYTVSSVDYTNTISTDVVFKRWNTKRSLKST